MSDSQAQRSPRFMQWVAFLIFSIIVLGSAIEASANSATKSSSSISYHRWSVACAATTFCIAFISVVMHLFPICSIYIVGTKVEGFLCVLLIAFWAAEVAVVTDPKFGLAVDSAGAVSNGNLFYFSWAGLVCAVVMETSYLRDAFHVDMALEMRNRASRLAVWTPLLAASCVVLASSVNSYNHSCDSKIPSQYIGGKFCHRAVFGGALGAISAILSFAIVTMKILTRKTFFVAEAFLSILLLIAFAFGVALITADGSPGAPLGNLYYFTWLAFFVSFMLCASLYEEYFNLRNPSPSPDVEEQQQREDNIAHERMDDI